MDFVEDADAAPSTPAQPDAPAMPLQMAQPGETVELAAIRGGRRLKHRLAEMGLTPGATFRIISKGHPGPFIIQIMETRLVLGRGMIHHITVRQQ
ncbi:hypothetical protein LCGC14_0418860 [marine sediment metagenome]|uniref:Ferrous iron transporter FeoA-like domain-containing protein n=1 Tax=marine sediment metagenome TaxID=412755 RepID=A0A0F9W0P4_9ZZZZ|nr:ferrous iron transport protein A [Phycisphaerae bacterium]HDZ44988.1 ferrous iron transport protein A [Phycisphaerae bacterium]